METFEGSRTFYAESRSEWRKWLARNCRSENRVWLIVYHAASPTPSVSFQEAIEEAICFGWIDSKGKRRGPDSAYLCFSRRNPKSTWGKTSRERAERMIRAGLMTANGRRMIETARRTGTWDRLADAQNTVVPPDLKRALAEDHAAKEAFQGFAPSSRRIVLQWIAMARRPETRQRRIRQAVELAAVNRIAGLPKGMNESRPATGRGRRGNAAENPPE